MPSRPRTHKPCWSKWPGRSQTLAQRVRSTWKWRRLSERYRDQHPWCRDPFGDHGDQLAPGVSVHHIRPVETAPELAFRPANLANLCAACHNKVEGMEREGRPMADLFRPPPPPSPGENRYGNYGRGGVEPRD